MSRHESVAQVLKMQAVIFADFVSADSGGVSRDEVRFHDEV